ncbi:MAG TPA: acyl carrier protein [Candidatus Acidoferrales bacterium]|nr:acyl carrier protein [Candidatus Acidoferrales bacterium]
MSEPSATNPAPTSLDFAEMQKLAAEILGVDPDQVQLDVSFAKDLAADSLDIVELIMAIEDRYQVSLPEEELEHMKKVGDLWTFLLAHPAPADQ